MPNRPRKLGACLAVGLMWVAASSVVSPGAAHAAGNRCDGVSYPDQMQVEGKTLIRNGIGIRRATIFNVHVYVAALYVERTSRDAAKLLKADQIRSLTLRFVRDVSRDEMIGALEDGIRASSPQQADALKPEMKRLERMLPSLREGNELTFRHVPGHGLAVLAGTRQVGAIESEAFASALFRIWLGPKPPDQGLKAGLLGGACE